MKLYIFNPENDLALADGHTGYTAPASARKMRHDLSWLPRWWAGEEDEVWDGSSPIHLQPGDEILPWGWSPALKYRLQQAGVEDRFLPTDEELAALRSLSHRRTAVDALHSIREEGICGNLLQGNATLCHTLEEVQAEMSRWPETILKAPWSGSGKGLRRSCQPDTLGWACNILAQQGSVVVEEWLDKLCDFALEFWLDGKGTVEYRGLSLFNTNEHNAYVGNWLAPEGQKLQWLLQYVPSQPLMEVRQWWTQYLANFQYRGPVGVDMMLCKNGICPCVEINWRMTMGMVAQLLTQQGRRGKFTVQYIYGQYSADIEAFS